MNGEDIKLDKAQRARAVALEPQVIDDPEWACAAIIWQRDQLAEARDWNERMVQKAAEVNNLEGYRELGRMLADRDAEIERLRKDLVWAVRNGVMVGHDECVRPCIWFDVHRGVVYDGTPESICQAVREARDGNE